MNELLDSLGAIVVAALIAVNLTAVVTSVRNDLAGRLGLAATAGAWVGFAIAMTFTHAIDNPIVFGGLFAVPLVTLLVAATLSRGVRQAIGTLPVPLLIGLNATRVGGVFFLALAALGRLAGPFPYSAGWGDIITGAFALPVAWLAARNGSRWGVLGWNAFGTLDLAAALTLGITSAQGTPLQIIHAGIGSGAIQTLPWSLIPTVLVPFYLTTHAIIFARIFARRGAEHERPVRTFAGAGS